MDAVELFLLGRTLMKIGEEAIPQPPGGTAGEAGSTRLVLIVASDIALQGATSVGEIATRTGLPQSQVSTAVARLKRAGAIAAEPDPGDRRRTVVRQTAHISERVAEIRASDVIPALAAALGAADPGADPGAADPEAVREVTAALETLARHFSPRRRANAGPSA